MWLSLRRSGGRSLVLVCRRPRSPRVWLPVVAMTQTARDEDPRCRSLVEDFLDRRDDQAVYHPIRVDGDD
jgi:hypothetical protein